MPKTQRVENSLISKPLPRQEIKRSLALAVFGKIYCFVMIILAKIIVKDFDAYLQKLSYVNYYCLTATLSPGPIVLEIDTLLIYCPFAAAGLALTIASNITLKLSKSFSAPNDFLPIAT